MATKSADLGSLVHTVVDPRINNGDDVAMALVTKVKKVDDETRVNLRVILDTGADLRFSNIKLVNSRPKENDADIPQTPEGIQRVAFWPSRS